MNNFFSLFKSNSSYILLDKIIKLASSLIVISLIARQLDVPLFGELISLLSIAALLVPIASLGLNKVVIKTLADIHDEKLKEIILSNSILMRFIVGFLLSGVSHLYSQNSVFTFYLCCQSFLALQLCEPTLHYQENFKAVCKARAFLTLVFALIKIVVAFVSPTIPTLLYVFALEILCIELAILAIFSTFSDCKLRASIDVQQCRLLLKKSLILMISAAISVIYLKLDVVMLEKMHSAYEAGIYSAASKVSEAWIFIPTVLLARYFPLQIKVHKIGGDLYHSTLQFMMDKTLLFGLSIVALTCLLSEQIIHTLYGARYADSVVILQLHTFASLFIAIRLLVSQWLILHEQYLMSLYSHMAGAFANVLFNYFLIPSYGAVGATISTILAYIIASYLSLFLSSKTAELRWAITLSFCFIFRLRAFLKIEKPWLNYNLKL